MKSKPSTHDLTVGALEYFALRPSLNPRSNERGIRVLGKNSKLKTQNSKLKFKISYFLLVFLPFAFCLLPFAAPSAAAQEMSNEFYKIQMGNFNSIAGISGSEEFKINITSGETAPNLNTGTNYQVRAGFQYIPRKKGFSLSVSSALIDFGTLTPTNPITRTADLIVTNLSAPGYIVTASENHQLLSPASGAIIPDTTCDKGYCSEIVSAGWENTLTYGFGYRCESVSILIRGGESRGCLSSDLIFYFNKNFYRQFADLSKAEKASTIISGNKGQNQKATITYKVNISSSQLAGIYTNSVTYIAIPTF